MSRQDQRFLKWMDKVDAYCWKMAGCSVTDLADVCFGDLFDDGVSPRTAAVKAIRADQGIDE